MKTRRQIDLPVRSPRFDSNPLWRALVGSFVCEIELGRLTPGSRVPSSRTLARVLRVSRTTVSAAYDELASLGYLRGRVGDGTYVDNPNGATSAPRPASTVGYTRDEIPLILFSAIR